MKKIFNKIIKFSPSRNILKLYFLIPLILVSIRSLTIENDIWFLLNHGKYVIQHGFPTIEPFSMHHNFSFVMQQWLSATIFYLSYSILGKYGLWLILLIVTSLIMFFLYKLISNLSDNKFSLSVILSVLTTILMILQIVPRPQIFTILILIIIMYIMENFYKNPNSRLIYFLPFISILQINLHSSMWMMLYIFILPFYVSLLYDKIVLKKNNKILKLTFILLFSIICSFFNPYGINAIKYIFNSYGNYFINKTVTEMQPISLDPTNGKMYIFNLLILAIIFSVLSVYLLFSNQKIKMRHFLLLFGVIFLALSNIRNLELLVVGSIPFLSMYINDKFNTNNQPYKIKPVKLIFVSIIIFLLLFVIFSIFNNDFTSKLENGVDAIYNTNEVNDKTTIYTNYDNGSYVEYRGLRAYLDTRAEVFIKQNNKKYDILKEYYLLNQGYINYNDFINKYNFDFMIVDKCEKIYLNLLNDNNYKLIYNSNDYSVYQRILR